jgi:predicted nuclease with TOPRIM domain
MSNHMYDSSEIEEVLDAKIKELTAFYEAKLEESNRKHRTVITTLRSEMQELTQEIDLKKSIEVQIYQDIINHTENQSP